MVGISAGAQRHSTMVCIAAMQTDYGAHFYYSLSDDRWYNDYQSQMGHIFFFSLQNAVYFDEKYTKLVGILLVFYFFTAVVVVIRRSFSEFTIYLIALPLDYGALHGSKYVRSVFS